jgi:hypothetical protein
MPRKVELRYGGQSGSKSTVIATRRGVEGRGKREDGAAGRVDM